MSEDVTGELLRALGSELRAQRTKRGLSRLGLAKVVGVSETTVGRIERDGPVDVGDTWRMARVLGVPLAELVRAAEREVLRAHRDDATDLDPLSRERLLVLLGYDSDWDERVLDVEPTVEGDELRTRRAQLAASVDLEEKAEEIVAADVSGEAPARKVARKPPRQPSLAEEAGDVE